MPKITRGIGRGRELGAGRRKLSEMASFDVGGKKKERPRTPAEKRKKHTPRKTEREGVFGR